MFEEKQNAMDIPNKQVSHSRLLWRPWVIFRCFAVNEVVMGEWPMAYRAFEFFMTDGRQCGSRIRIERFLVRCIELP